MTAKERPWVIWLTRRHVLGAPLKLVSVHGAHATQRLDLARRFATAALARRWLARKRPKRLLVRYKPLVDRLRPTQGGAS